MINTKAANLNSLRKTGLPPGWQTLKRQASFEFETHTRPFDPSIPSEIALILLFSKFSPPTPIGEKVNQQIETQSAKCSTNINSVRVVLLVSPPLKVDNQPELRANKPRNLHCMMLQKTQIFSICECF